MQRAKNESLPNCEIDIIIEGAVEKQEWFLLARCALKSHDFCHKKLEAKYGWGNNFFALTLFPLIQQQKWKCLNIIQSTLQHKLYNFTVLFVLAYQDMQTDTYRIIFILFSQHFFIIAVQVYCVVCTDYLMKFFRLFI